VLGFREVWEAVDFWDAGVLSGLALMLAVVGTPSLLLVRYNESVVNSSNIPAGKLHKRHIALSWHRVRESIAANILYFIHIPGAINPSDMLSKQWGYQQTWTQLQALLFWQGDTTDLLKEEKRK
jgi:hypothetical protein